MNKIQCEENKRFKELGLKKCRKCLIVKPLDSFEFQEVIVDKKLKTDKTRTKKVKKIRYVSHCKECFPIIKEIQSKKLKQHREKYILQNFNNLDYRLKQIEDRARKREIFFNITKEDIVDLFNSQQGKCYYTGLPITLDLHPQTGWSPDRLDSNLNYTKDNIVLCLKIINLMKMTVSKDDFIYFSKAISKNFPD